jgi:two-component system, NtrC family, response regulator AtoC
VQAGSFRSDLYFRLNGMTIRIPPLRDRLDEVPSLAATLLAQAYARARMPNLPLAPDTLARLTSYAWPGNVRELRNVIERAVVLASGGPVRPEHLLFEAAAATPAAPAWGSIPPLPPPSVAPPSLPPPAEHLPQQLERLERERIEQALTQTGGNQTLAAQLLGITRRQLIARIESYGLPRPRKKDAR